VGIVIIFWGDVDLSNPRAGFGMGTVVISTIMQAYTLTIVKRLGQPISPFVMNFAGMSLAVPILLLLSALTEDWGIVRWNASSIGSLLYLSIIGSVLTFVSYYWLLKRIAAVYLSLTSFINPIVAVILGAAVLGETLGAPVLAGAALVLLGILVANGRYLYGKAS
jgi:drug/metabolite transporter (DMT)-like permease